MIIPALDLMNGNIVRLYQGCFHKQRIYSNNPLLYLEKYFQQGAKIIHLVDLEGAKNPTNRQIHLLHKLLRANQHNNLQIGGGIRSTKDIADLLKLGAKRVVFSSQGIKNPYKTKKWFEYFGSESLVLAIDIRMNSTGTNNVVINGWQTNTTTTLQEIIEQYHNIGLKHVLCTDISKDGTLTGSNTILYQTICKTWPDIKFQSSGGIKNLDEIHKLRDTGVTSIIIGRALLEEKFTISEAISCWQNA
ncbi:1-(5-phosphoribosyl)-5-[(5-phosphoribosylamino)methylideneamino]imidazole-4-carboxamide isomerase [Blochmannia endosymbiont of Polyrhachis (Hedomyrma) turneri]|uniref:1-(5-phosphoribosyl)-5-[(5- phosphoribosylamino)methylideneamino]imidazole-4- carboxamide isomerase n=1 Tax=Blochmannia endosymbiont of Polyrhachis (Hedomyrma) turneri TaxID=1505596 RepID=UPI00061A808B|nr:1-(5-phosphoribosyl)-5-[(5-phosphoribosylamino)methylideneamino]imidazole-4-carboxamide isomerase [Blochmannia endosymbiont of Polyrhachis (Hedomyrma) turneri]AKC60029.1 1-(5-phosphoribosyl)-5-[(5-phosphoribosylamino)methylideneamino] imidazole-4-carboxamide isomerase [Blochmannia endosymbiont of Polyrhachis (Hedomyrma) turneri]